MSTEQQPAEDVNVWGVQLRYAVDLARLTPALRQAFVPSRLDTEGEAFLATTLRRPAARWKHRLQRLLTLALSDFDANGLLGIYPVFLLSTPQALLLLEAGREETHAAPRLDPERSRLLDIGAGSGDVTTRLAPLVASVQCTETSRFMARRLRKRGFACWLGEAGQGKPGDPLRHTPAYDVITLFNVIDRCRAPRSLLRSSVEHLPPGGSLLVSVPLPYEPFYYASGGTRPPAERLRIRDDVWEVSAGELWHNELEPLGLELAAMTRAPYLSGGDADAAAYVLDSAIIACRKRAAPSGAAVPSAAP